MPTQVKGIGRWRGYAAGVAGHRFFLAEPIRVDPVPGTLDPAGSRFALGATRERSWR
jgi:hypothetical protein